MGFVIFLLIVAAIVVLIVVIKKNKRKKAIEDLKNSNVYELALKIKDKLEKKAGVNFGEPHLSILEYAWGYFSCYLPSSTSINIYICIYYSEYRFEIDDKKKTFQFEKKMEVTQNKRLYGIENENIGIMVTSNISVEAITSTEDINKTSQDAQEYLKIAAEVIENNGYGQCSLIER